MPVTLLYDPVQLEAVCKELVLRLVVLYGSRAKGVPPPTPQSDLDLALLGPGLHSWERLATCYWQLEEIFPNQMLDLVSLGGADPLFRYEIMSNGILLYGDPDLFLEYRAYAYKDFVESADLRALEDTLFRKKMAFIRRELYGSS